MALSEHRRLGAPVEESLELVERIAFWCAIVLPCLHVPALVILGLDRSTAPVLGALWTLHALCLAIGARHDPDRRPR